MKYKCANCGKAIDWGVKFAGHRWGLLCPRCAAAKDLKLPVDNLYVLPAKDNACIASSL
jgi:endogenous inhibitor of DNA gyrase (YacG/DUF329 family)